MQAQTDTTPQRSLPTASGSGKTGTVCIHYLGHCVITDATDENTAGNEAAARIKCDLDINFEIPLSVPCVLRQYLSGHTYLDRYLNEIIPSGDYDLVLKADTWSVPTLVKGFDVHEHPEAFVVTVKPTAELTQEGSTVKLNISLVCTTAIYERHYLLNRFSVDTSLEDDEIMEFTPGREEQATFIVRTEGTSISLGVATSSSPSGTIGFGDSNKVAAFEVISSWSTGIEQTPRKIQWIMEWNQKESHFPPEQSTNGFMKEFTAALKLPDTGFPNTITVPVTIQAELDSYHFVHDAADVQKKLLHVLHKPKPHLVSFTTTLKFNLVPTMTHFSPFFTAEIFPASRPRLDRLKVQFGNADLDHD